MQSPHIPVLFDEVLEEFKDIKNGYLLDCTLGYGGHSIGLLKKNSNIKLIANDQDEEALKFSKEYLKDYKSRIIFNQGNFEHIIKKFKDYDVKGILADIGVSSLQLDKKERGFSFKSETLDMRMDGSQKKDAALVLNEYPKEKLEKILSEFGEIREAKKVTNLLCENRPFQSAKQLADFLAKNLRKTKKIHSATLVFQALRIEVNDELGVLKRLLESIEKQNFKDCKLVLISFHSLEDRIVKNYFKKWSKACICPKEAMKCTCGKNHKLGRIISKKPILAKDDELKQNPRSRSAKMRVFYFE